MRRDAEPRRRLEIVEAEPDAGLVERHVCTALDVGRAAVLIVNRLAVDGDVHHVKFVRALRTKLAIETRDVYTLIIVQRQRLVVYHLYAHERLFALNETGVHDVIRLDVTTSFMLGVGT